MLNELRYVCVYYVLVAVCYLSSGDGTGDLSAVSAHHFAEGGDDIRGQPQATVISQDI